MGAAVGGIAGGVLGGIGGALSNQKEGSTDAGNLLVGSNVDVNTLRNTAGSAPQLALAMSNNDNAVQDVQANPILSQLYGQGGTLSQATGQYQNLLNNPGLTSQDQTAYGQASGQIANQFGQSQQSLAQSLANRGLSNSGAAGAAFTNSFGNQNEQLAQLQTQIAQNRENLNLQKQNSIQNFLSQMGQGAQSAINSANQLNQTKVQNEFQAGQQAQNYLMGAQGQNNQALQQRQQTGHASTLSNAFGGMASGIGAGMSMGRSSGMSGGDDEEED